MLESWTEESKERRFADYSHSQGWSCERVITSSQADEVAIPIESVESLCYNFGGRDNMHHQQNIESRSCEAFHWVGETTVGVVCSST